MQQPDLRHGSNYVTTLPFLLPRDHRWIYVSGAVMHASYDSIIGRGWPVDADVAHVK